LPTHEIDVVALVGKGRSLRSHHFDIEFKTALIARLNGTSNFEVIFTKFVRRERSRRSNTWSSRPFRENVVNEVSRRNANSPNVNLVERDDSGAPKYSRYAVSTSCAR
jgi:hypothetical protein